MPTFVVTEAKGHYYKKPPKSFRLTAVQAEKSPIVRDFFFAFSDEIKFAEFMLKDAGDGAQLPHHLKETLLCYTNKDTNESHTPRHTYFKFNERIYVALTRNDVLGAGHLSMVKRVMDTKTGEIYALKLVKPNSEPSTQFSLTDLHPIIAAGSKKANPLKVEDDNEDSIFGFGYSEDTKDSDAVKTIALSSSISLESELVFPVLSPKKEYQLLQLADTTLEAHAKNLIASANTSNAKETLDTLIILFIQATASLEALHEGKLSRSHQSYVHTDIKPENFLITFEHPNKNKPVVTVGDLDSCVPLKPGRRRSMSVETIRGHGTPGYISPEAPQLNNITSDISYTIEGDIFSLGKAFDAILKPFVSKLPQLFPDTLPKDMRAYLDMLTSLIARMCAENPNIRPDLADVIDSLKHDVQYHLRTSPTSRSTSAEIPITSDSELEIFFNRSDQAAGRQRVSPIKPAPSPSKSGFFSPKVSEEFSGPFDRQETQMPNQSSGEEEKGKNSR